MDVDRPETTWSRADIGFDAAENEVFPGLRRPGRAAPEGRRRRALAAAILDRVERLLCERPPWTTAPPGPGRARPRRLPRGAQRGGPELALDLAEARYAAAAGPDALPARRRARRQVPGAARLGRHPYLPTDPEVLLTGLWVAAGAARPGRRQRAAPRVCAETRRRGGYQLEGLASDADPAGQAFLERRGFRRARPLPLRRPRRPDRRRRAAWRRRPDVTLTSLAEQPDLTRAVYAVACEAIPDVPEEKPMAAGSYEDWRAFWIDPPSVRPERVFLATVD